MKILKKYLKNIINTDLLKNMKTDNYFIELHQKVSIGSDHGLWLSFFLCLSLQKFSDLEFN
jgi:hypothetical protein